MSKRTRDENAFSTLSVFTYHGPLCVHHLTSAQAESALPAMLKAIFGSRQRHSVFSLTAGASGCFLVLDEALHRELFGGSGAERWSCLYIHESSSTRNGADVSGSLSLLFDRLTEAQVPLLNVCTLRRNFVVVRQSYADLALRTLRSAIAGEGSARVEDSEGSNPPPKGVHLRLLRTVVAIGALSVAQLKSCAHALIHLLFLRRGEDFVHFFEMGGEISLALGHSGMSALASEEPESAAALSAALEPSLSRGWRVLDVTAATGYNGIGILSAVCLPLATLPLMNFSTLDHTYILVPEAHLEAALKLLQPHFDLTREVDA